MHILNLTLTNQRKIYSFTMDEDHERHSIITGTSDYVKELLGLIRRTCGGSIGTVIKGNTKQIQISNKFFRNSCIISFCRVIV